MYILKDLKINKNMAYGTFVNNETGKEREHKWEIGDGICVEEMIEYYMGVRKIKNYKEKDGKYIVILENGERVEIDSNDVWFEEAKAEAYEIIEESYLDEEDDEEEESN